jgi:hypothetical protein
MGNDQENQALTPEIEPATPSKENGKKKYQRNQVLQKATEKALRGLISTGISIPKASALLGIDSSTGYRILQRLEEQGEGIKAFLSASRDEKLEKVIDNFLDKGAKLRVVKGSDALGAAKLYADRRYPVRQEQTPGSVSFVKVDNSINPNDDTPKNIPNDIKEIDGNFT